ncbi:MAG: DUF5674 family protein [Candidatus Babeliales bacterium]|jgi:hypothetical protein
MHIVTEKISLSDVKTMSTKMFGNWMKAVVDIEKEIMVVDADLHADEEALLLEGGSEQQPLWGINIHPEKIGSEDFIILAMPQHYSEGGRHKYIKHGEQTHYEGWVYDV